MSLPPTPTEKLGSVAVCAYPTLKFEQKKSNPFQLFLLVIVFACSICSRCKLHKTTILLLLQTFPKRFKTYCENHLGNLAILRVPTSLHRDLKWLLLEKLSNAIFKTSRKTHADVSLPGAQNFIADNPKACCGDPKHASGTLRNTLRGPTETRCRYSPDTLRMSYEYVAGTLQIQCGCPPNIL